MEVPKVSLAFCITAVVAGIVGAALIPGHPVGLNVPLVAVLVAVGVVLAAPTRLGVDATVFGALSLGLVSMAAVRSAQWVVSLDLLFAALLALVAVGGGAAWIEITASVFSPVTLALRGLPFVAAPLAERVARPLSTEPAHLRHVLRGLTLAAVLLLVFGTLFVTSDDAFAYLAGLLIPSEVGLLLIRVVVFLIVVAGSGVLALAGPRFAGLRGRRLIEPPFETEAERPRAWRLGSTEWIIAVGLLDLLFACFFLVQVTVLFGGRDHVLSTAGLTYAEYARQGFFQLLVVAASTLGVVAAAAGGVRDENPRHRRRLRALLGILCVLTLVVLASALRRLGLYEDTFGFTRARITAHATALWLGGMLGLVMAAGVTRSGRWLPRAAVALTGLSLLAFSLADPEDLIASRNVQRYRQTRKIDIAYLSNLSSDAVSALSKLPSPLRECALLPYRRGLGRPESVVSANLSRVEARRALAAVRRRQAGTCMP